MRIRFLTAAPLAGVLLLAAPALAQPAPAGPLGHRLFLAPTAEPVAARRATLGVSAGIVPHAGLGLGHGLSVDAHAFPTGFALVNVKATREAAPGVRLGGGVMAGRFGDGVDGINGPPGAVAYGVATVGTDAARVNALVGLRASAEPGSEAAYFWCATGLPEGFVHPAPEPGRLRVYPQPVVSLGADVRLSRRVRWIAEAAAVPEARRAASGLVPPQEPGGAWSFGAVETGYGTVVLGSAARAQLGRVALEVGAVASRGRAPGAPWDTAPGGLQPFPWLGLGVGL